VVPDPRLATLVLLPGNITNAARVALGSPPAYRVRPTWYMPAQHSNSASAAVVAFIYRSEASRHTDFSLAPRQQLPRQGPIGQHRKRQRDQTRTRTGFPDKKTYMITPREIVDTMIAKHDMVSRLAMTSASCENPFRALTSLSDLANHIDFFLLVSQRLTWSGQEEKDYCYFELLSLET
jgi:hypothetical protein